MLKQLLWALWFVCSWYFSIVSIRAIGIFPLLHDFRYLWILL